MVLLKIKNMKNLKKLMFGLAALVMAFGLVFSVSAFKKKADAPLSTSSTFFYNGPLPATQAEVEKPENWKFDNDAAACDDEPEMACSITVNDTYVDKSGAEPVLQSSIALQAQEHASLAAAFVVGSADNSMQIINRSL